MWRPLAIALLAAMFPTLSNAQRMSSSAHFGGQRFAGQGYGQRFAQSLRRNSGDYAGRRSSIYPVGLFSDPLYYGELLDSGYPVASQPPMVVMQYPANPAPQAQAASVPMQPLVIELQGGRYVRVSGDNDTRSEMVNSETQTAELDRPSAGRSNETPASLIFRDGHQEEVRDYTIADGVLYARGDFYAGGAWTKKIDLAALNLQDTIKANQSRGIRFRVPSASNEVIVGP